MTITQPARAADRYAARLRAFVETWPGRPMAHIAYMTGRKVRESGQHWSMARRLTYQGQRLARLGYLDAARGLPDRMELEDWPDGPVPGVTY